MIDRQKRYLQSLRFDVKAMIETAMEGENASIIQRVADEENVTLKVMGARGRVR